MWRMYLVHGVACVSGILCGVCFRYFVWHVFQGFSVACVSGA